LSVISGLFRTKSSKGELFLTIMCLVTFRLSLDEPSQQYYFCPDYNIFVNDLFPLKFWWTISTLNYVGEIILLCNAVNIWYKTNTLLIKVIKIFNLLLSTISNSTLLTVTSETYVLVEMRSSWMCFIQHIWAFHSF